MQHYFKGPRELHLCIFAMGLVALLLLSCSNPSSPQLPSPIQGKWKLVKNDAVNKDGTYDHDSPVGIKCPEYWLIAERNIRVTTTEMGVQCANGKCDTLKYCYMTPRDKQAEVKGKNDLLISGHLYSYEFEGDTLVLVDDPDRNPYSGGCCENSIYKSHFIRHAGNIPPDDSPCNYCN